MGNVIGNVGSAIGNVAQTVVNNAVCSDGGAGASDSGVLPFPILVDVLCPPTPPPTLAPTLSKTPTPPPVVTALYALTVLGTDSIHLAGRTDVTIPDPSVPWPSATGQFHLLRHGEGTLEELKETLPPQVSVSAGDVVKVSATGGISYEGGFNVNPIPPQGTFGDNIFVTGTNIDEKDGISGFAGPTLGPLVGLFLNNSIPSGVSGSAPSTLNFNFNNGGIGVDFISLEPELGQVFYVGNGKRTSQKDSFFEFVAPPGATRVLFGVVDGYQWEGESGLYDDNDGRFTLSVAINQDPNTLS